MMNKRIFGTDGIRALSNDKIFNNISLSALSSSIIKKSKNFRIVIGRDTRESSKRIENNLIKELKKNGAKIFKVGLITTPAIAYITQKTKSNIGIVISASHNPYQFNGIKFFDKNGCKLSSLKERNIEKDFYKIIKKKNNDKKNGKIKLINNPFIIYKNKFNKLIKKDNFPKRLKVVIDCANGSSFKLAKYIFSKININPIYIKDKPNGKNINYNCGSLNPEFLAKEVKKKSADFGISFDGDGDRLTCCDEKGKIIDGDHIIALLAKYYIKGSRLKKINAVVGTLMSNSGLENFINKIGLKFYRAKIGDKFVYEIMKKKDCFLGGEQSGHIIIKEYGPSGDGILISLLLIKIISKNNQQASKIFNIYNPFFQIQKNIKFKDSANKKNIKINDLKQFYNNKLIDKNRVLIRFSGTEPILRLLVEGRNYSKIKKLTKKIHNKIIKSI